MTAKQGSLSPKTIWGKVVLFLKEHRQVALHVACGDITDVEITSTALVVKVKDSMLNNLLCDGRREIENALRWQGLDLNLEIDYKPREKTEEEKDIEKLNTIVGDFLIVK
ncbi:MAG: hypothetical protein NC218_12610 [Acetobacter sp.]|nr:hypothetical protein [Acetobacter sp.]